MGILIETNGLNGLNGLIGSSPRLSLSSAVEVILTWQVAIVALLSVWVVAIILYRRTWGLHVKARSGKLQEFLVEQVMRSMEQKELEAPALLPWEGTLYRNLLISTIITLQGKERTALVRHYEDCGYLVSDERLLRSTLWWRRLSAAIRLSQLEDLKASDYLISSLADPHPLVSQIALEALSHMKSPRTSKFVLEEITRRPPKRDDLLIEFLVGCGTVLGSESILDLLSETTPTRLRIAAIRAVGRLRSSEAVLRLLDICREQTGHHRPLHARVANSLPAHATDQQTSEELLEAALISLRMTGDPRVEDVVWKCLQHPSSRVRVAAIELGATLGSDDLMNHVSSMAHDPAVEVRRVVHSLVVGRVA